MNQALEAIYKRRSIRKYKPEQISREELDAVLKAGVCAPHWDEPAVPYHPGVAG